MAKSLYVDKIAKKVRRDACAEHGYWMYIGDGYLQGKWLEQRIADILREMIEKCAVANCRACEIGILLEGNYHVFEDGSCSPCRSNNIRALAKKKKERL